MENINSKSWLLGLGLCMLDGLLNYHWLPDYMMQTSMDNVGIVLRIVCYLYLLVNWYRFFWVDACRYPVRLFLFSTEIHLLLYLYSIKPLVTFAFLLLFLAGVLLGNRYLNKQKMPSSVLKYKFWHFMKSYGVVILTVPAVWALSIGWYPVFEGDLRIWKCTIFSEKAEETLFQKLEPDVWVSLSEREKLEVLQYIHCMEAENLGIPCYPVYAEEQEDTRGFWSVMEEHISMNRELLETEVSERTVLTLLHETRHAYQYYNIGQWEAGKAILEEEATVREWAAAAESYEEDCVNDLTYFFNELEVDARNYSGKRTYLYSWQFNSMAE